MSVLPLGRASLLDFGALRVPARGLLIPVWACFSRAHLGVSLHNLQVPFRPHWVGIQPPSQPLVLLIVSCF